MAGVTLTIDGSAVTVPAETTILKAAVRASRQIPTICYHDHCTANGLCRICVVEVDGVKPLLPACFSRVNQGMNVITSSARVVRSRRTILELLASAVDLSEAPEILKLIDAYRADPARFPQGLRRESPVLDDNPMYIRDYAKCILCWRCVQVCAEDAQFTYAINFKGRGFGSGIGTFFDRPMPETTCVFCGQCVGVCPTGALKPKREALLERGATLDEIIQATRGGGKKRRCKTL
ncbi:MAG TPA: 2Fe-2S iron-sulfur cluster-binding protein [Candidatus Eisenbacteria bacterium]|nr:2Fe-2S iron-sulfur cluster-binding protein [Candidatus Eisenbacteria bacterium]